MNYILLGFIAISNIITSYAFINFNYGNGDRLTIEKRSLYKPVNNIQCAANAANAKIDRRGVIKLIPLISIISLSKKSYGATLKPQKIVVFGASGYTGGDTIRALLEKNISVVAVTRRKVEIVDREHAKLNTLVIDDLDKKGSITSVVADVLSPNITNT